MHAIICLTAKTFLGLIGMYTDDPPREWHPRLVQTSYLGVSEGIIQWTLYEQLKTGAKKAEGSPLEWVGMFGAARGGKMIASLIPYPHEVCHQVPPIQKP